MACHVSKNQRSQSTFSILLERIRPIKNSVIFSCIAGISLLIPGLALPAVSRIFVDQVLMNKNLLWAPGLLIALGLIFIFSFSLNYLREKVLYRSQIKLSTLSGTDTLWHLLRLPYSYFAKNGSREAAESLSLNDSLAQTITYHLIPIGVNTLLTIVYGIALFFYDPIVALSGFAAAGLNVLMLKRFFHSQKKDHLIYEATQQKKWSALFNGIKNRENIKEMGSEPQIFSLLADRYTKAANSELAIEKKEIFLTLSPRFFYIATALMIFAIGGARVIAGSSTAGIVTAQYLLMLAFLQPIFDLAYLTEKIPTLTQTLKQLAAVGTIPIDPLYDKESKKGVVVEKKLEGYLSLEDVSFSYPANSQESLAHMYFALTPGKTVALTGPSGGGKSTIVNLIGRLYTPTKGKILFDHKPREEISKETIRNSLAIVQQAPFLIQGTAKENLSLLDPALSHRDIVQAAKDACIHNKILSRKGGYDMLIEEGGKNLSDGEKNCFEIARALCRNPSILILDETTAHLDEKLEAEVIKNIQRRGISLLLITKKESSLKAADEIIVMDKGKIREKGTYDELYR